MDKDSNIWIKKLCEGDENAYNIFFKEYYSILGSFALKYVKEIEVAEDIVHDVIFELYTKKRVFSDITSLKAFLYLSIKNKCLTFLDKVKAKERYLQDNSTKEEEVFFLNNILEEEVFYLISKAIGELPKPLRKIYKLSMEGKTNEEIAEDLHLTIDSVKAYKKRGKQILRDKLKGVI